MMKETITILTLSKGRMKGEAEKVFRKNKLKITRESERSLIGSIKGYPNLRVLYMNATEIIEALGKGIGDIGISGKDLWLESDQSIQSNIVLAKQYNWGRSDLIVAVDTIWIDCVNPMDLEDISYEFYRKKKRLMRCATKFKNLAHGWFNSKGITQYELITSLGATEAANKLTADLIVDLSTTGESLLQNNLKVIDTILSSSACLFYAKKSIKKKGVKKILKLLSK